MFALFCAAMLCPTPAERRGIEGVVMADVKAFKITGETARKNYSKAASHANDELRFMIRQNNPPEVVLQWEADWRWRWKCWDLLDDVLYCTFLTEAKKLHSLGRLRELLGDDDYFAGRMPCPIPFYRK